MKVSQEDLAATMRSLSVKSTWNYLDLIQLPEVKNCFEPKHIPIVIDNDGTKFIQRSNKIHTITDFKHYIVVLVKPNGELFEDSYSEYIEMPTYPCYIALYEKDLKNEAAGILPVYIVDCKNAVITSSENEDGVKYTFVNDNDARRRMAITTDEVNSPKFLKTVSL